ncbi:MAG: hypothetical protein R8G33_10715 [Gammaproteobacteria bacterium]|nr:hypothetical protein [Gammaproteobacteria bacterium]
MSAQAHLNTLVNTLIKNGVDQEKISVLRDSFNDEHVEVFLENLAAFEDLNALIDDTSDCSNQSNLLIDTVSELISSK